MSAFTRRTFLRATVISMCEVALRTGCAGETDDAATYEDGSGFFPQSVASGDPRATSVIVWTRVVDPDDDRDAVELELQISADEAFSSRQSVLVTALAEHDFCVKVRISDVAPATTFYYRFVLRRGDGDYVSRTGRTRTAPAEDADAAVRFAFVSCQDFNGRYFNNYLRLAELDLDFFVHLGDYVYETTGDPSFQDQDATRRVVFSDPASAIVFNEGEASEFHAAASLSNYRDLYRTYRGDLALQAMHERTPMIAIWDDHEFSDDCHGATATYHYGRVDEEDVARRKAANRAWFEYMPVDYADPDFVYDESADFPGDLRIHRDFTFGRHVHLVMTDLRTYRSDHPIAEDAFPGEVVLDEARVIELAGAIPEVARPYVDIASYAGGAYATALAAVAATAEFDPASLAGNVSVDWINAVLDEQQLADPPPIDEAAQADLPRGIAYYDMGKRSTYSSFGSRVLVVKPAFDLFTRDAWLRSGGASEQVMGAEQEEWFLDTMEKSTRTWKLWGNEFCLNQISVDIRTLASAPFNNHYYLILDLWDGHRNRRGTLLDRLAAVENVVALTGDIHGFHAGTPLAADDDGTPDPNRRIVEFVTSSISSSTFKEELRKQVDGNPSLEGLEEAEYLINLVDFLLTDSATAANPNLGYSDSTKHGFIVVECDGTRLDATYHKLPPEQVREDYAGRAHELTYTFESFRVNAGEGELWRDRDGTWVRWDPTEALWV